MIPAFILYIRFVWMESEMSEVLNRNKENAQNIERIQGSIHTKEADRNTLFSQNARRAMANISF